MEEEQKSIGEVGSKKKPKWLLICASILVIGAIGFGVYYFQNKNNNSSNLESSNTSNNNSTTENEVKEDKEKDVNNDKNKEEKQTKDDDANVKEDKNKDNKDTYVNNSVNLKKVNYYISNKNEDERHYVYYDGSVYNELFSLSKFDEYIGIYNNQVVYQGFDDSAYIGIYDPNTSEKKELIKLPKGNCTGTGCVSYSFQNAWVIDDKVYFVTEYDMNRVDSKSKYKTEGLNYINLSASSYDDYVNIELTGVKEKPDAITYVESERSFYYSVVTYINENNNFDKSYVTIYSYNVDKKETKEVYKYSGTHGSFILKNSLIAYFTESNSHNVSNIYNIKTKKNIVLSDNLYLLGDFSENVVLYDNNFYYYNSSDKKIYKFNVNNLMSSEYYTITGPSKYFRWIKVYNNKEMELFYDKYRYNERDLDIEPREYVLNGKKVDSLPKPKMKKKNGETVEFEYGDLFYVLY